MPSLKGRINRATYWLGVGLIAVIYAVLNSLSSKQMGVSEVVLVFLCVPRLHDIGKSGWFVLVGVFIELSGLAIGYSFFALETAMAIAGTAVLVVAGLMIWLGVLPGNPGPNQWGEPPAPGISFRRRTQTSTSPE